MVTIKKYVYVLFMALFVVGMMSSCNPIDKINELKNSLLGDETEQVDEDDLDEDNNASSSLSQSSDGEEYKAEEPQEVFVEKINIDSKDFSIQVGQTKQLKVKTLPEEYDEEVFWRSSDGSANIIAYTSDSQLSSSVMVTVTPKSNPNYGTVNLGYGTYTGDLKNGQPHGHGTIVYSTSHKIVNSADYYAKRGDKFEADFRDGRISGGIGYWYHDGDITAINP